MAEPIRIEATLTRADMRRWFLGRLLRRPIVWLLPPIVAVVGVAMLYLRAAEPTTVPVSRAASFFVVAYLAMATWMIVVSTVLMLLSVARLRSDGMFLERKCITIDESGVTCAGDVSTHTTAWKLVERLERRAVGMIFALRDPPNASLLIPRRALDDATIAGIESLFARSRAS